jgi:hypothetical protein
VEGCSQRNALGCDNTCDGQPLNHCTARHHQVVVPVLKSRGVPVQLPTLSQRMQQQVSTDTRCQLGNKQTTGSHQQDPAGCTCRDSWDPTALMVWCFWAPKLEDSLSGMRQLNLGQAQGMRRGGVTCGDERENDLLLRLWEVMHWNNMQRWWRPGCTGVHAFQMDGSEGGQEGSLVANHSDNLGVWLPARWQHHSAHVTCWACGTPLWGLQSGRQIDYRAG